LDVVLSEVRDADVDRIVVGGDVLPGPMPLETLERLFGLDVRVDFIHGNGELAVIAQILAKHPDEVTYWGSASGEPPPEPLREIVRWTAKQLRAEHVRRLEAWPKTLHLEIDRMGEVLFCHATPRSETEIFTRLTPLEPLRQVFEGVDSRLVICGHTHMQFDRVIDGIRVVNAGSVGMPFGRTGADWLVLGPEVELRHTAYDLAHAAALIRETAYPQAADFASNYVLSAPSEAAMLEAFTYASFK
jgi:hypothetical protein